MLVTAASVSEREGGKQVLKQVNQMGEAVSRLHTIWVDGGNDCEPFMQWVMNFCRWTRASRAASQTAPGVCFAAQALGGRTDSGLACWVSTIEQRL